MVSNMPAQPHSAHVVPLEQRYSAAPIYPASNQPWVGIPTAPMNYPPEQRHAYQPGIEYAYAPSNSLHPPTQHRSPVEIEPQDRPPLPPRPSEQPPSPHDSMHSSSSSSGDTAPSWRTSIEPDPLPPHSNPQALSQAQSEAYSESKRIPDISLGADELWNTSSGLAEFRLNRDTTHLPRLLSSKGSSVSITRTSNGQVLGTVKFHTFTSSNIELVLPSGRSTSISHSGFLHNRWGFQTLSSTNTWDHWYWKKDRSTGGAMLENSKHKHGEVLARLQGDCLRFVRPRLREEEFDEIVLSAVAMAEAARRQKGKGKGKGEISDLGSAIGELTGTDGGS